MEKDLSHLATEQTNEATRDLDRMDTLEIVTAMNREDRLVPQAVERKLPEVARAVDAMVDAVQNGGRVFYIGAGTSGRLGVLDASECPPTFSSDPEMVQGIIAGGDRALRFAVEGAEDSPEQGAEDLRARGFGNGDFLVGIAASGRTPYVLGALAHGKKTGAKTAAVTCNPNSEAGRLADIAIDVETGPEILTGSTRLKSGTAQKLVLNMLSTAMMVRLGKTYGNLMVDLKPTNRKLRERSRRIVALATGADASAAESALAAAEGETKTAIVMLLAGVEADTARHRLTEAGGRVREALERGGSD